MFALLVVASLFGARDTIRLRDVPCHACAIAVDTVVVLGDSAGPGELQWQLQVVRDSRGRYLVAHQGAPSSIVVFSARGEYMRSVGQRGGGPGEFRRVWRIFPLARGILVADDLGRRFSRFDAEFRYVSSHGMEASPLSAVLQNDGSGLVSAIVQSPSASGFAIHELDSVGRFSRAVGVASTIYREDLHEMFVRDVAAAGSPGKYWSSHRREYAFELRSRNSAEVLTYLRSASWFPQPRVSDLADEDEKLNAPAPQLRSVSQADSRYVWTLVWVPDRRWRTAVDHAGAHGRVTDFNLYYDSIVERIDLLTGQVVSSARMDQVLWQFTAPGESWFHEPDKDGRSRVYVVRFTWSS